LSKESVAEIKYAEIKTCKNLEKTQNLEPAEKTTYTVLQKKYDPVIDFNYSNIERYIEKIIKYH
jgi:hypothetical protein